MNWDRLEGKWKQKEQAREQADEWLRTLETTLERAELR